VPPRSSDNLFGRRPVATAVAGAAIIAFSAILVRLADVSPETAAVFRCAYAIPPLAALALWERRRYGPRPVRDRWLGIVAGALFSADLIFWHHAIDDVGAGLATVLGNLQVVLVAFLAWAFLGERPGPRTATAVPVVIAGAVLISGLFETGAFGDDPARGTLFGIATTMAYAGYILVLRQINADIRRPAGPLLDATAASAVISAAVGATYGAVDLVPHGRRTGGSCCWRCRARSSAGC
jgi:drug/metabolite transporter (DMT)-like permease